MTEQRTYPRFSLVRRLEHWGMVATFVTLALTGLPQK
jgi:cytochrome b subunit of formate dehydrogenase